MPRTRTRQDRLNLARKCIEQARALPAPAPDAFLDLSYAAAVKDLLRQAREAIQFIHYSPTADDAVKAEVKSLFTAIEQTEAELLRRKPTQE